VTDKVTVVVPEVQPPADRYTTVVTILSDLSQAQGAGLDKAAGEAAAELNAELGNQGITGVTVKLTGIKAVQAVNKAAAGVSAVTGGSISVIYGITGEASQMDAALVAIGTAWPEALLNLLYKLQLVSIPNLSGDLVNADDVSAVILVDGKPITEDPPIGPSPPPEGNGNTVGIQVDALAQVDTSNVPDGQVTILEGSIKGTATGLAVEMTDLAATTVDSVKVTKSAGGAKTTAVVVMLTAPENEAATVVGWLAIQGNKNIIREAIWKMVAELTGQQVVEFGITITASIKANEPPPPPK
jgi:hypothetical protein